MARDMIRMSKEMKRLPEKDPSPMNCEDLLRLTHRILFADTQSGCPEVR